MANSTKGFFLDKYKNKTEQELRYILEQQEKFQTGAVEAAAEILSQRFNIDLPVHGQNKEKRERKFSTGELDYSFNSNSFIESFGFNDLLTSFSLAILVLSLSELLGFYSSERFIEPIHGILLWTGVILTLLLNHIIYRIEHKKANNFIGRSIHDFILAICLFSLKFIYSSILDPDYSFSFGSKSPGWFWLIVALLVLITMFEMFVSVLKTILRLFKWQIL